jgi:hypothetical protein
VNNLLLTRLKSLVNSPEYSGNFSCGVRLGGGVSSNNDKGVDDVGQEPVGVMGDLDHNDGNDNDDEELGVDETDELVGKLIDYVSGLALLP